MINRLKFLRPVLCILLSGLDGCGLCWNLLYSPFHRHLLCGIIRSGPSGIQMASQWSGFVPLVPYAFHTLMGRGREGRRELDSNLAEEQNCFIDCPSDCRKNHFVWCHTQMAAKRREGIQLSIPDNIILYNWNEYTNLNWILDKPVIDFAANFPVRLRTFKDCSQFLIITCISYNRYCFCRIC